jgi:GTPase Era involved in 16S rRNA processing
MIAKLDRAIEIMGQANVLEEQVSRASQLRERIFERELIISVIGQFKRGKSSLINDFLGDELLPVGIIPLTTAVTEIRHGNCFQAVVRFTDGTEQEISRDELPDYISEQKNPNNQRNVAVVKLWTEHTPFDAGITLVDTPGVGSTHQHNTLTSYDYIEKSDAVLFLLSVDSPVSEMELAFLLRAREQAAKFYFAVNKTDTVSQDNLIEFLNYCKAVLSEAIGMDVVLYPISAKTSENVSSLVRKLSNDLIGSYDELLEASMSIKLNAIIEQARNKLALYLKAVAIPAEELKSKISLIKSKQLALDALSDEVNVLTKTQTERLVTNIKNHLEEMLPDILTSIETQSKQIYDNLKSLPSKQFESKFSIELETILKEKIEQLNKSGLAMLKEGYTNIVGSLNKKSTETARYVSEMVMEYFGAEYMIKSKEYQVSEKDDNFTRLNLYYNAGSLIHLLGREKANAKIFDHLMRKSSDDLHKNKTRILYNYRYKMQESLRTLSAEFAADICQMSDELNELLDYVEQSHTLQSENLQQTEVKFEMLLQQLDRLNTS